MSSWLKQLRRSLADRLGSTPPTADLAYARLGLVRLEDRVVLDGSGVVADLQPGAASSSPAELTPFNGSVYFSANGTNSSGQDVGRELYRLDADGTVKLVADINTGTTSSNPADFVLFDGRLVFAATGSQGRELYQVDTSGVVSQIADINPGVASSNPAAPIEFGSKLYVVATGATGGRELYVVNQGGNATLVEDINPGAGDSNPTELVIFGDRLYFAANNGSSRNLYRLNSAGAANPTLINLGAGVQDPRELTEYNGKLYFNALDSVDGRELFALSVNNSGGESVTKVANLNGAPSSSSPGGFFVSGGNLYFAATTADGRELFRLDSSSAITSLNLAPGGSSSAPAGFTEFNSQLYFAASVGGQRGLYQVDTSTPSLAAVSVPLPTGVTLPNEVIFQVAGGSMYFAADGPLGRELYRLNASGAASLVVDINAGTAGSGPAEVTAFASRIYFVASDVAVGRELRVLIDIQSSLQIVDGHLVFNDVAGDRDNRLVISSDGTVLRIVDQNGLGIVLLTTIPGAGGVGTNDVSIPLASLTGVNALDIYTRGGNDSVTWDLSSHADAILGQFNTSLIDGGANRITGPGDVLRFFGDGSTTSTYTPDATTTGSGAVAVAEGLLTTTFSFAQIEPVEFGDMFQAWLVTPPTATGDDALFMADGWEPLDGLRPALVLSGTVGGASISPAYFLDNQSLIVNTTSGIDGDDLVTVTGASSNHGNVNLTISTGMPLNGVDAVLVNGALNIDGNLSISTTYLEVRAAIATHGAGAVVLTTTDDISISADVSTESGLVTLSAGRNILADDEAMLRTQSGTILLLADSDQTLGGTIRVWGDIDVGSGQVIFSLTDTTGEMHGSISGSGGVVKQGAGTLTIAGSSVNSYTGPTDLMTGALIVDGAIGSVDSHAGLFTMHGGTMLSGAGDIWAPLSSAALDTTIVSAGGLRLGDDSTAGFDFAGKLLVRSGDTVVLRDADLAQLGVVTQLEPNSQLVAAHGVEVGRGDSLVGSGAVAGSIVVLAGGQVSPGLGLGIVATNSGNVHLMQGGSYVVELGGTQAGTQYDQLNVQGTVSINGATLNVSLLGGFRPTGGTKFTLITNDGDDAVTGQFRSPNGALLPEGSNINLGGIDARLSYRDGPNGNNVTLTVSQFVFAFVPGASSSSPTTQSLSLIFAALVAEANRRSILTTGTNQFFMPDSIPAPPNNEVGEVRVKRLETQVTQQTRLYFRVVNEGTGKEDLKDYPLELKDLGDLLGIFKRFRFPDGKYRIYLQEPDRNPRRVLEVNILEGRVVPPNFRETEQPAVPRGEVPALPEPPDQGAKEGPGIDDATRADLNSDLTWRERVHAVLSSDPSRWDRFADLKRKVRAI